MSALNIPNYTFFFRIFIPIWHKLKSMNHLFLIMNIHKSNGSLVVLLTRESGRLFRVKMLITRRFEVDMNFVSFRSGWIGRLNGTWFSPRFWFILVFILLEVRSQRNVSLPSMICIHNSLTNNNIKYKVTSWTNNPEYINHHIRSISKGSKRSEKNSLSTRSEWERVEK